MADTPQDIPQDIQPHTKPLKVEHFSNHSSVNTLFSWKITGRPLMLRQCFPFISHSKANGKMLRSTELAGLKKIHFSLLWAFIIWPNTVVIFPHFQSAEWYIPLFNLWCLSVKYYIVRNDDQKRRQIEMHYKFHLSTLSPKWNATFHGAFLLRPSV